MMSQVFYFVPILLFFSALLGSSVAKAPALAAATFAAPQLSVAVTTPAVAIGASQALRVHLDQSAERTAVLVLVVTYPSGVTERSLHSARGSEALLTWTVPREAGVGVATFSLSATGCACGQQGTVPPPAKLESAVAGKFQVSNVQ